MNMESLDFAHLKLLDALIRRRSLSEAAALLEIPQPTASHALARLRKVFGDPLLVRTRKGMEPTAKALSVATEIEQILDLKRRISGGGRSFEPAQLDREFVVAGSDVAQLVVINSVFPAVSRLAPRVKLRTITLSRAAMVDALQAAEIDIALGAYPRLETDIHAQTLYSESYRCFATPEHAYLRTHALADFVAAEHIAISTRGMAHAHRMAEQRIIKALHPKPLRMTSSNFLVALAAAAASDMIVTAPGRAVAKTAAALGLGSAKPPINIDDFDVKQYWHSREHNDPAHLWFRKTVFEALAEWRNR
jgi:DNA-binding transcriptional LysR family regulator